MSSNFHSILDALDKYAEQTGINLKENPFADKVMGCDSPNAVLLLLQENLKAFKDYRDQNRKFIDNLSPVVQFVHAFSGTLGEAASTVPFQPAKLIFVGIEVLFTVRVCITFNNILPISRYVRRPKVSARAMTLFLNSSNASATSSNASKFTQISP
ncbi:hypothetical protein BJY52DRAFT_107606 [Lactarius psammicola]|nr:hypothetical protein BJY52DRAFT_107606 [Lactarius psammicola]